MESYNVWLVISFVAHTLGIISIGLYSSRLRKETSDDFVLANRELGPWVSALSASAGKAFEAMLQLSCIWGVLVGTVVNLTYTVTGGFQAIC